LLFIEDALVETAPVIRTRIAKMNNPLRCFLMISSSRIVISDEVIGLNDFVRCNADYDKGIFNYINYRQASGTLNNKW